MENDSNIEVILLSKASSFTFSRQQELVKWLMAITQSVIVKQHETTKRLILRTLRDSPAIYLS